MTDTPDTRSRQREILVLGGTGKTGRRVARRLAALGQPVRVGSRSGTPPFDWDDSTTWGPALRGVGGAYVSYQPDLAFPGAAEAVGAFAAAAVRAGVDRLVLLSGRGEEEAARSEQAVRDCGAEWTVLRASWFSQNFSEAHLLESVLAGELALPAGDVAEPFVDAEDIADVAVAALTGDGHGGRVYELTGPRLLTFADATAEITRATGRPVRYVPVTVGQYESSLVAHGLPAPDAAALADLFGRVLDGRNAHLADGTEQALGRRPRDFAAYVRDAAASGVWGGR